MWGAAGGVWGCSEHEGLYRGLWGMLGLQVGTGVSWGRTEEIWGILSMGLNGGNWGWTEGEGLPWGYMEILWVSWGTQAPRGCTGGSRGTPWGWVPRGCVGLSGGPWENLGGGSPRAYGAPMKHFGERGAVGGRMGHPKDTCPPLPPPGAVGQAGGRRKRGGRGGGGGRKGR